MADIDTSGFYRIGYGLAGGFEKDRAQEDARLQLQKDAAAIQKAGLYKEGIAIDEKGNPSIVPNSDIDIIQQQNKMLNDELFTIKKQLVGSQAFQLIDDYTHNRADALSINRYLNSDNTIKDFFSKLNVDHVIDIDFKNENHLFAIAKAVGSTKFKEYMADNAFTPDEVSDIKRNFLLTSNGKDIELNSIENMLKVTGATQYNFSQERFDKLSDNIKLAKSTLTSKLVKYTEEKAKLGVDQEKQAVQANQIKNETDQLTLDMLKEARDRGLTYEDILKGKTKDNNYSQVANTIEYLRGQYGDDAADAYVTKMTEGTKPAAIKTKEFERKEFSNFLESTGASSISEVNYGKLTPDNRRYIDEMAISEIKDTKIDMEDVDNLLKFGAQANRLDVNHLSKAIGPIDNLTKVVKNTLGIQVDPEKMSNSATYSAIVNTLIKTAYGKAVSPQDMSRMVAQIGSLSKGDKNVMVMMSGMLDDTFTTIDRYKTNSPAFYIKNFKTTEHNLHTLKNQLDAYTGLKGKTTDNKTIITPSKQRSFIVADSNGNKTPIKLGGHYKANNGKTYQLTGIDKANNPIWKEVSK